MKALREMKATAPGFRAHLKALLDAIDRGETVTVVDRGNEKAKLMPIDRASLKAEPQIAPQADQKKPFKSSDHPAFDMYVREIRDTQRYRGLWYQRSDLGSRGDPV